MPEEFRMVRPMLDEKGNVVNQADLDAQDAAVADGAVLVEELTSVLEARAEAGRMTVEEAVKTRLNPNSPTIIRDLCLFLVAMCPDQYEIDDKE